MVADDPGMHSSQNEQDSRHYAMGAKLPMLEPSNSAECCAFAKAAFELSEKHDTPVLLRLHTRVSHSQSLVELAPREERALLPYEKRPDKYVMTPANAIRRHPILEERMRTLGAYANACPFNTVDKGDAKLGIITSGICYQYVKDVFPTASVLKLGMVYPLPEALIREFAASVEQLYIVEELDPILETFVRSLGIEVAGGKAQTGLLGELSQRKLAAAFGLGVPNSAAFDEALPVRPPVPCPGCPHRGLFYTLNKLKLTVFGDIGCYTLGAMPPLGSIDTTVCMGASISMLHGFTKARGEDAAKTTVGVIGDSTFVHSGVTGLIDIVYNQGISTVLILDNAITGMTGHQQNPTTGMTLKNQPTTQIKLEKLCEGAGVRRVRVEDPQNLASLERAIVEELAADEPSVIIVRRPCALLKSVKPQPPLTVCAEKCAGCRICMRLGCPALVFENGKAVIDQTLCVGCGLCAQMCHSGGIGR